MPYHHGNLREALLERAAEVVAERGVEALSLRGLARDLGVSHAAPSRHFTDRHALISELAKEGFRRGVEAMHAGAEAAGPDPVARYRAIGRAYVRFACEQTAFFRAIQHPEVRDVADDALRSSEQEFFTTLRTGAEAARRAGWHPEADANALVAFSTAAAMGAAQLLADDKWRAALGVEGADIDALADAVLDLTVHRNHTSAVTSPNDSTDERDDIHPEHAQVRKRTRRAS